jgi:hypothetical protein
LKHKAHREHKEKYVVLPDFLSVSSSKSSGGWDGSKKTIKKVGVVGFVSFVVKIFLEGLNFF